MRFCVTRIWHLKWINRCPLWGILIIGIFCTLDIYPTQSKASPEDVHIERIESYLAKIETIRARFNQVSPDGSVSQGLFYLRRPGRFRFEYDSPTPLLVVGDSFWIVFEDRELGQLERIPMSSTPLSILTQDNIDFRSESVAATLRIEGGLMWLTLHERDDEEQGSLTLTFDQSPTRLRQWIITDSQGLTTEITLSQTETNVPLDPKLFVYNDSQNENLLRK